MWLLEIELWLSQKAFYFAFTHPLNKALIGAFLGVKLIRKIKYDVGLVQEGAGPGLGVYSKKDITLGILYVPKFLL